MRPDDVDGTAPLLSDAEDDMCVDAVRTFLCVCVCARNGGGEARANSAGRRSDRGGVTDDLLVQPYMARAKSVVTPKGKQRPASSQVELSSVDGWLQRPLQLRAGARDRCMDRGGRRQGPSEWRRCG